MILTTALVVLLLIALLLISREDTSETFATTNNPADEQIAEAVSGASPRFKSTLKQALENKWGFIPEDKRLTGNSETSTMWDPYAYWDPKYNYADYWNYSYPLTLYARPGAIDYRSFGHSMYSNLFQLPRSVSVKKLPYQRYLVS